MPTNEQFWRDHFGKSQKRTLAVSKEGIDVEKRTVPVAFSSETPVMRSCWDGDYEEILDHSPGAMRAERLNGGLAVLFNHDRNLHLGTIEPDSGRIDKDKVGRAVARFGNGALASEKFQDVQDGILGLTSFLYDVHAFDVINGADGKVTVRITDWEPLEISFVTIPADPAVGVGRSKIDPTEEKTPGISTAEPAVTTTEEGKRMFKRMREYLKSRGLATDATTDQEVSDAFSRLSDEDKARAFGGVPAGSVEAEQKRTAEILELGEKHGFRDDALQFVREKKTVDEFKNHVLEQRSKNMNPKQVVGNIDASAQERSKYSIGRAIQAMLDKDWTKAGFEREMHEECLKQRSTNGQKSEARGFLVPLFAHPLIAARQLQKQRQMNKATPGEGGYLIPTEHLPGEFIAAVYERSLLLQLGARALPGLRGDLSVPRLNSGATTYHIDEDDPVTPSGDDRFGNVLFSPKTIAAKQPYSRRLLKQSDPIINMIISEDLSASITSGMDLAGFQGLAVNKEPVGILNQTGINTVAIAAPAAPTWAEIVAFETALETDLTLMGNLAYVFAPAIKGALKSTARAAGTVAGFIWEKGEVNGYKAASTTNMPANGILFGNFADLWLALWGDLDLKTDDVTNADSGGFILRAFQDYDWNVRRTTSFAKNTAAV